MLYVRVQRQQRKWLKECVWEGSAVAFRNQIYLTFRRNNFSISDADVVRVIEVDDGLRYCEGVTRVGRAAQVSHSTAECWERLWVVSKAQSHMCLLCGCQCRSASGQLHCSTGTASALLSAQIELLPAEQNHADVAVATDNSHRSADLNYIFLIYSKKKC